MRLWVLDARFGRWNACTAEHDHGALDTVRLQVGFGSMEFERETHGARTVALQKITVVLGQTIARAVEDGP